MSALGPTAAVLPLALAPEAQAGQPMSALGPSAAVLPLALALVPEGEQSYMTGRLKHCKMRRVIIVLLMMCVIVVTIVAVMRMMRILNLFNYIFRNN
jgi:hypothetical protein